MREKPRIPSEPVYFVAILTMSFAVAMMSAADLGLSMVVSPAYIISRRFEALTFGQCEYIFQAMLFALFCILMRRIKIVYFFSFFSCLLYGAALDMWRSIIPAFNPSITTPGAFPLALRLLFFAAGMCMTAFSVAMFFKSYLYSLVYDFFVKFISAEYGIDRTKFKRIYDASSLALATIMTMVFFQKFVGIGWGTLVMAMFGGLLMGFFDRTMDRYFEFVPLLPKLAVIFKA